MLLLVMRGLMLFGYMMVVVSLIMDAGNDDDEREGAWWLIVVVMMMIMSSRGRKGRGQRGCFWEQRLEKRIAILSLCLP